MCLAISVFIVCLYRSRHRIRPTVPITIVPINRAAHTDVIRNPIGKIPSVTPESWNDPAATAAEAADGATMGAVAFAVWFANTPFTNDASAVDRSVLISLFVPGAVALRVTIGTRKFCNWVLS